jgi:hypothetical protein
MKAQHTSQTSAAPVRLPPFRKRLSLSAYFPAGTTYFYGYPAGTESGFLNNVDPSVEELVASRAFAVAGPRVSVVSFAATSSPELDESLLRELGVPQLRGRQNIILPIDVGLKGAPRNAAVKQALQKLVPAGTLVMAQPYTDKSLAGLHQIPPEVTTYLNDKQHMAEFIDEEWLPKRFGTYKNGASFAKESKTFAAPCVVKVSSSSSGDGVFICDSPEDVAKAAQSVKGIGSAVCVEQLVTTQKNYAIHFGVPENNDKSITILGVNEQVTSPEGEFLGGFITGEKWDKGLQAAIDYLQGIVLPKVRKFGWYGVGGIDVLRGADGRFYFIDCNFRMTGMSAYQFLAANGRIAAPLLSFGGTLIGSQEEICARLLPLATGHSKFLHLIAMSRHGDTWRINGAITFKNEAELRQNIEKLMQAGVASGALERIASLA